MAEEKARLVVEVDSKGVVTGVKNLKDFKKAADGATKSTQGLTKSGKNLITMSSQIKEVGRSFSRYITLPLVGATAASIKFTQELNKGLGQVQTLIPDTGNRIFELQDAVRKTATETGKSFTDLTEGLYETISAFQDGEDTVGRFNVAVRASIAGLSTTKEAVQLLSAVTKAYGDTSTEATQKVSDLAFETVRLGQTTFPELARAMQVATDSSDRLLITQEELFAVFATLTGVVGNAEEVATKLRSANASLLNPTKDLANLYDKLGVASGEAFIQQEGLIGALLKIKEESEKTGLPMQKFIKRIEGIALVERLTTRQTEIFLQKLEALEDSSGASETAFREMTEGIYKFGFELGISLATLRDVTIDIGEKVIPVLTDLLQNNILPLVTSFTELDDSTQKLIITLGAFAATLGPALTLVGAAGKAIAVFKQLGIGTAIAGGVLKLSNAFVTLGASMMGTTTLGASLTTTIGYGAVGLIGGAGLVGALGALAYMVYKNIAATKEVNDYIDALDSVASVTEEIKDASQDAAEATFMEAIARQTNKIALIEEANALTELERKKGAAARRRDIAAGGISPFQYDLEEEQAKLKDLEAAYISFVTGAYRPLLGPPPEPKQQEALATWQEWFEKLSGIAKETFGDQGAIAAKEYIKSWQDEYDAVTFWANLFGEDSKKARETIMEKELEATKKLIQELISIDPAEIAEHDYFKLMGYNADETDQVIQGLIDRVKELNRLLADDPGETIWDRFIRQRGDLIEYNMLMKDQGIVIDQTDEILKLYDKTLKDFIETGKGTEEQIAILTQGIATLTEKLKESKDEAEEPLELTLFQELSTNLVNLEKFQRLMAEAGREVDISAGKIQLLEGALQKIAEGGEVTEAELAGIIRMLAALGLTAEEIEKTDKAIYNLEGRMTSFNETMKVLFMDILAGTGIPTLSVMDEEIAKIGVSLANWGIDTVAATFKQLGREIAGTTEEGYQFNDMLADQAKALLDMLPSLMTQVGLNILATDWKNLAGWALVAAGLSGELISGFSQQLIENVNPNAKGNAYSGGNIVPFRNGGAFTNTIVDSPTIFPFANGIGLMGEAGPEAVMPLTRTASGELGVKSTGSNVAVIINNNTNAQVQTEEVRTPNGKELYVTIGNIVKKQLNSGELDKSMVSRYGLRSKGISA